MLVCALVLGSVDAQAQNKKKGSKKKAQTTATTKKGKKKSETPAEPTVVALPANSNDCLFAIPLQMDKAYGPTSSPDGAGRIQEVVADKAHPNIFEREHNTVWYKFTVPYNGELEIAIVQESEWDDYDFLVYKNTGTYFSNQVMLNKVSPVASNMAGIDSAAMFNAVMKKKGQAAKKQVEPQPEFTTISGLKPHIGMFVDATDKTLTKQQTGRFIKSIPVRMGEEYYVVLDNRTANGQGHTIEVSVHVNAYEPLVLFYDKKGRKYVDVDLMILERGGKESERPIVKDEHYKGGKVKFVPGFSYLLYAKRDGYFSIYREFNSRDLMLHDTIMLFNMERTERGSSFQISQFPRQGLCTKLWCQCRSRHAALLGARQEHQGLVREKRCRRQAHHHGGYDQERDQACCCSGPQREGWGILQREGRVDHHRQGRQLIETISFVETQRAASLLYTHSTGYGFDGSERE